jgi:CNT family concentrative nucleoside transporter
MGLLILPGIAWLLSEDRSAVRPRMVIIGIALQLVLALLLLKLPLFQAFFLLLNQAALALGQATRAGTAFVFGYLGGAELPFTERAPGSSLVLAFRILPLILVMSALSALLFHWRILPLLVRGFAWALRRTLGIGGALGLATAANVFVGMVEAPLLIRPYLQAMSRSELFAVMTVGMATIAGTVMVLYAQMLASVIPDALGHIVTASLISAPAALTMAGLMVPPQSLVTEGDLAAPQAVRSSMDAITRGTLDGLTLLLNIIALLVVLVALVSLANQLVGLLPEIAGQPLTLQRILGGLMAPLMWLLGVPWSEAPTAGALMGTKIVLNELLAYLDLARLPTDALSEHSRLILVYALCGFANFGSLGIMLGGLGAMAPERRDEILSLGLKAIVSGTLATCMTGAVVGIVTR